MGSDLPSLLLQRTKQNKTKKQQNSQFCACQELLALSHDTLSVPPERQLLVLPVLCLDAGCECQFLSRRTDMRHEICFTWQLLETWAGFESENKNKRLSVASDRL